MSAQPYVATAVLLAASATFLVALVAVGVALLLRGVHRLRRLPDFPAEAPPPTHGMPLGWLAPIYEWYLPKLGLGAKFRAATMAVADLKRGDKVLEVGCGTGILTILAAQAIGLDGAAVGIDPAPEMIAVARRKGAPGTQFRLAAIEALPFPDRAFDVVMASLMLHHLPPETKREGLREVFRVLRPGGKFVVVDLDRPTAGGWWLLFWPLLAWPMTAGNLRGEIPLFLEAAGFSSITRQRSWFGLLAFWSATKAAGK